MRRALNALLWRILVFESVIGLLSVVWGVALLGNVCG